jgi:biopolymer transport protein ExbB
LAEAAVELLREYLDLGVFGILGLMSFLMLWFAIERSIYYRKVDLSLFSHPDELNIELTRNLTAISSIGSNAPYVGLLGTVLGILLTFYDLGQGGGIDTNAIMLGLALALKATAMGLLVAIPAILIYNGLLRRVDVLTARWNKEHRS